MLKTDIERARDTKNSNAEKNEVTDFDVIDEKNDDREKLKCDEIDREKFESSVSRSFK